MKSPWVKGKLLLLEILSSAAGPIFVHFPFCARQKYQSTQAPPRNVLYFILCVDDGGGRCCIYDSQTYLRWLLIIQRHPVDLLISPMAHFRCDIFAHRNMMRFITRHRIEIGDFFRCANNWTGWVYGRVNSPSTKF